MLRSILAVLAGLVLGMFVITAVESIIPMVYPMPRAVDPRDIEAMRTTLAGMPVGVFVILMLGWILGALAGGLLAARLASTWFHRAPLRHALAVGVVQTIGAVTNFAMLPHPTWVLIAGLVVFIPMALLGGRLGQRPAV
ncbi:MAG TPA: hypothetical protein VGB85_26640 [Nannocystis sp.]